MYGPYVIQVYGPRPWESKHLIDKIQSLIDSGKGDDLCKYVRYAHQHGDDHIISSITIREALAKIYEGRDISPTPEGA